MSKNKVTDSKSIRFPVKSDESALLQEIKKAKENINSVNMKVFQKNKKTTPSI